MFKHMSPHSKEIPMPAHGSYGPCRRRPPLGESLMDLLDMSITSAKGNRYVLVMVDCFSRWTEACPLPDKTAISVADAFFNNIVCRFGMPSVIHSDQGRELENKVMHELCILGGSHKTKTTPYHPESDGLVERINRTLLPGFSVTAPWAFIWFLDGNENKVDISIVGTNGKKRPWGAPTDGRCYRNSR